MGILSTMIGTLVGRSASTASFSIASVGGQVARHATAMAIGLACCAAIAAPATAADIIPTYRITSPYNIGPILLFGVGVDPDSGDEVGPFITRGNQAGGFSTAPGTSLIVDDSGTNLLVYRSFFLGVSDLIPGALSQDPDAPAHLILGVGNFYGASLIGQDFGALFAGYNETDLINAVRTVTDFSLGNDAEFEPEFADAFSRVAGFQALVLANAPNSHFGLNEGFSVIAFSRGQLAGTGFFFDSAATGPAVPEPASWAMMIIGFGAVGAMRRRQSSTRPFAV